MPGRIATAVLLLAAAGGCSGSNVVVTSTPEGTRVGVDNPPVEASVTEKGVEGPPTPTPAPLDPIIPITPLPTATPGA